MNLDESCEIIFQEHKANPNGITWTKQSFEGVPTSIVYLALESLLDDGIIKKLAARRGTRTIINSKVIYVNSYQDAKKLLDKVNEKPSAISVADVKGSVFIHSPVSESIINTSLEPTVTPKKR